MKEYLDDEQAPKFLKFLGRVFYHGALFCHGKKLTQQRQNSFGKHEIFTKALAKINFENHKELTMNEVRYHCQSCFNLSLSAVQLLR